MKVPPAIVFTLAREFLGLTQEDVEGHSKISRSSIQRIERGKYRLLDTVIRLQEFYEGRGIVFLPPVDGRGWGLVNNNLVTLEVKLDRDQSVDIRNS
ncbi:helix-turn-helix domain-containing protein [Rhizobium ruizarguesonis]|jgi:transcriptional regulator with XRE-family HTH domain